MRVVNILERRAYQIQSMCALAHIDEMFHYYLVLGGHISRYDAIGLEPH